MHKQATLTHHGISSQRIHPPLRVIILIQTLEIHRVGEEQAWGTPAAELRVNRRLLAQVAPGKPIPYNRMTPYVEEQ
jgi:hypothetical protein